MTLVTGVAEANYGGEEVMAKKILICHYFECERCGIIEKPSTHTPDHKVEYVRLIEERLHLEQVPSIDGHRAWLIGLIRGKFKKGGRDALP